MRQRDLDELTAIVADAHKVLRHLSRILKSETERRRERRRNWREVEFTIRGLGPLVVHRFKSPWKVVA